MAVGLLFRVVAFAQDSELPKDNTCHTFMSGDYPCDYKECKELRDDYDSAGTSCTVGKVRPDRPCRKTDKCPGDLSEYETKTGCEHACLGMFNDLVCTNNGVPAIKKDDAHWCTSYVTDKIHPITKQKRVKWQCHLVTAVCSTEFLKSDKKTGQNDLVDPKKVEEGGGPKKNVGTPTPTGAPKKVTPSMQTVQ